MCKSSYHSFNFVKEEELDEQHVQISPPGFHLIFLPFADDLRKLSYDGTPRGKILGLILPRRKYLRDKN